jgi:hypothetical protein
MKSNEGGREGREGGREEEKKGGVQHGLESTYVKWKLPVVNASDQHNCHSCLMESCLAGPKLPLPE